MSITLQEVTTQVESIGMKYQGFVDKFKAWKKALGGLTNYRIEQETGYSRANLTNLEKGLIGPSDDLIKKLAAIPHYGLTEDELLSWRARDEYGEGIVPGDIEAQPKRQRKEEIIAQANHFIDELGEEVFFSLVEQVAQKRGLKDIEKKGKK